MTSQYDEAGHLITPSVYDPTSIGGGGQSLNDTGPVGPMGPVEPSWSDVSQPWFANMPSNIDQARQQAQAQFDATGGPSTYLTPEAQELYGRSPTAEAAHIINDLGIAAAPFTFGGESGLETLGLLAKQQLASLGLGAAAQVLPDTGIGGAAKTVATDPIGNLLLSGGIAGATPDLGEVAGRINALGDQLPTEEIGRGIRQDVFFPRQPVSGGADVPDDIANIMAKIERGDSLTPEETQRATEFVQQSGFNPVETPEGTRFAPPEAPQEFDRSAEQRASRTEKIRAARSGQTPSTEDIFVQNMTPAGAEAPGSTVLPESSSVGTARPAGVTDQEPELLRSGQFTSVGENGQPVEGGIPQEAPPEDLHANAQAQYDRYIEEQSAKNQPQKDPNILQQGIKALVENTIGAVNNTARAIQTLGDFASYLRLAPDMSGHAIEYAKGAGNSAIAAVSKDPSAYLDNVHQNINDSTSVAKGIPWNERGITVDKMFDPEIMGAHGAGFNPSTGERDVGNGLGLVNRLTVGKMNERLATLNLLKESVIPGLIKDQIETDIRSGKLPADFNLNKPSIGQGVGAMERYEDNVAVAKQYGQAADLLMGHAKWQPLGSKSNPSLQMLVNFGNWWAAQGELLGRAGYADAKSVGNILTGGKFGDLSPANLEARKAVNGMALGTSVAFLGANIAQGLSPNDPRNYRNGHVVLVVNPTGGKFPKVPGFADNTQIDTPVGAYYGHLISAIGAGLKGVEAGNSPEEKAWLGTVGAAGNLGNWARTLAAYVPARLLDWATQRTAFGDRLTLGNQLPTPINVSPYAENESRAPGAEIFAALGGRPYEPSPSQRVKYGQYDKLAPEDQLKAMDAKTWDDLSHTSGIPKSLSDQIAKYGSHYEWYNATRDQYVNELEKGGVSPSMAQSLADKAINNNPLQKAYSTVKNYYEAQWIVANPQLAEKTIEEDNREPDPSRKQLSPNTAERMFLQQMFEQAKSRP